MTIAAPVYRKKKQQGRPRTRKTKEVCISNTSIGCQSLLKHSAISFLSRQRTPIGYSLYQSLVSNYTPVRSKKMQTETQRTVGRHSIAPDLFAWTSIEYILPLCWYQNRQYIQGNIVLVEPISHEMVKQQVYVGKRWFTLGNLCLNTSILLRKRMIDVRKNHRELITDSNKMSDSTIRF